MVPDRLDLRALNRAFLDRQMLLRRSPVTPYEAVEHLIGLQAQSPNPPYVGLWTRLQDFTADALSRLITERRLVRVALMRSTIHLVTDRDCLALRPLVQPVLERQLKGSAHGRNLAGLDIAEVVAAGRALVEAEPRTTTELGALLQERWPDRFPRSLAFAIRNHIPLVQVPPRGLWGKSGQPSCTSAEQWLGRPVDTASSLESMVLRYLGAFGPATVADVQAWSGLTRLREIVERLASRVRRFRDDRGKELFDLPDAPRPGSAVEAPARFLPEFDNALLSHADRRRIITDEHRRRLATSNGMVPGVILVDGFLRGTWKVRRTSARATLIVQPYERIAKSDRASVSEEGSRLLTFLAPSMEHDVEFARQA